MDQTELRDALGTDNSRFGAQLELWRPTRKNTQGSQGRSSPLGKKPEQVMRHRPKKGSPPDVGYLVPLGRDRRSFEETVSRPSRRLSMTRCRSFTERQRRCAGEGGDEGERWEERLQEDTTYKKHKNYIRYCISGSLLHFVNLMVVAPRNTTQEWNGPRPTESLSK